LKQTDEGKNALNTQTRETRVKVEDQEDNENNAEKQVGNEAAETKTSKQNPEKISRYFKNLSPNRVSISWRNPADEAFVRIIDVLESGQDTTINTFVGHQFMFSREGTTTRIGDVVTITEDQEWYVLPKDAAVFRGCENLYERRCKELAEHNECERNPGWMIMNCPISCNGCELQQTKKRCDPKFLNVSTEPVWQPGDLNIMFEAILERSDIDVSVLSRPPEGPWILQFDNFLSDTEVEALVDHGHKLGFARSTDTGVADDRGEATRVFSTGRTSTNAWCRGACERDPVVQDITSRIVDVTKIPSENYESFQLLRYEVGQFYRGHHDLSTINGKGAGSGGWRILTFFTYLSDVEEGGETGFPRLGLAVKPKKGRAILWPSVYDNMVDRPDMSTFHEAKPVKSGLKFAANHWIHSHNFQQPNKWGCTGNFD